MSDAAPNFQTGAIDGEGRRHGSVSDLYRRHYRELVQFLKRNFGSSTTEHEDAAQVAFEQFAAIASNVESPRAFLYRCAQNYLLDQRRRLQVRKRFAEGAVATEFGRRTDELDGERVLDAKDRIRILENVINRMDPQTRDVFLLNRLHDLSHAEISRRKRISQTQSKRLVARALSMCQEAMRHAERC